MMEDTDETYIRLREGDVAETEEVEEGTVFFDRDADGNLLGIEILGPCQILDEAE